MVCIWHQVLTSHPPLALQNLSEVHALQARPPVPHTASLCPVKGTQCFEVSQQPDGHDAALHTHCPLELSHFCIIVEHEVHAPPAPHCVSLWLANGTQLVPLQHPVVHEFAVQTHEVPLHS
jgi:hypothetical protein